MKQHFESNHDGFGFGICPITEEGGNIAPDSALIVIDIEKNEITQACINRIVDNLNKLAEHAAVDGK